MKNDQKNVNKMIVCSGGRFWNFIQGLKVASFMYWKINGCLQPEYDGSFLVAITMGTI